MGEFRNKVARALLAMAFLVATDRFVGRMIHAIRETPLDEATQKVVDNAMRPDPK